MQSGKAVARQLGTRYTIALAIIGALATAEWLGARALAIDEEAFAQSVSEVGRLRMLGQRIELMAHGKAHARVDLVRDGAE